MTSRACARNTSPAAVSTIWRLDRSNSSTPSSFSSLLTDAERADCTTCIRWAAREEFNSGATATKYSRWRSSTPGILSRLTIVMLSIFRWTRSLVRVLAGQCPVDDHYFTGGRTYAGLAFYRVRQSQRLARY